MKTTFKFIGIIVFAFLLSFIPSENSTIISLDFLTSSAIDIFSIALAITALLFTVLDRYSEKVDINDKTKLSQSSFPVIKNMGHDILGILILIILLFVYDLLSTPIKHFQSLKFISSINLNRFFMLSILLFLLYNNYRYYYFYNNTYKWSY